MQRVEDSFLGETVSHGAECCVRQHLLKIMPQAEKNWSLRDVSWTRSDRSPTFFGRPTKPGLTPQAQEAPEPEHKENGDPHQKSIPPNPTTACPGFMCVVLRILVFGIRGVHLGRSPLPSWPPLKIIGPPTAPNKLASQKTLATIGVSLEDSYGVHALYNEFGTKRVRKKIASCSSC